MSHTAVRIVAVLLSIGATGPALAQRGQNAEFRTALARPYRLIADSAVSRILLTYPPGQTQGGNSLPYFATAADAQHSVLGDKGDAGLSTVPIYLLKGPKRERLAVASYSLNDDPSDHGDVTGRTLIFNSAGQIVASTPFDLEVKGVTGAKVVTDFGTIRWNGRHWVFPKWRDRRAD